MRLKGARTFVFALVHNRHDTSKGGNGERVERDTEREREREFEMSEGTRGGGNGSARGQ